MRIASGLSLRGEDASIGDSHEYRISPSFVFATPAIYAVVARQAASVSIVIQLESDFDG